MVVLKELSVANVCGAENAVARNASLIRFCQRRKDANIKRLKYMSRMRRQAYRNDLVVFAIGNELDGYVTDVAVHN